MDLLVFMDFFHLICNFSWNNFWFLWFLYYAKDREMSREINKYLNYNLKHLKRLIDEKQSMCHKQTQFCPSFCHNSLFYYQKIS